MSCQDEAHSQDHEHEQGSHDHGHGDHSHSHSHEVPLEAGPQDSLYGVIDVVHVTAMNAVGGAEAGQKVIKSWDDRDDETRYCESDADDTLILKVPFNASVSLRSITVKAGPSGQTPREIHLFKDAPGMDFSDAEAADPTQVIEVVESRDGVEYQVKAAKFASISSLTLYVPGNASDGEEDSTRIYYVGLRGSWKPLPNRPGVIIYESAARPTDHKISEGVTGGQAWGSGY
ncbi:hypothetical protein JCM24511_07849 [Saitozyma sp. JCM 24511]|nr:hypothetical protein JCM24511_07849 [Saitozyma sp. JCM 24511]